jgi:glycerophosphoryl diester phosphodiesterase
MPTKRHSHPDRPRTIDEFLELGDRPRVVAHRGFSGRAPENTLAACRLALEIEPDMIEVDLLLSSDGEVVALHYAELERTTNGSGLVSDSTLAELRRLDAGSWFSDEFTGEPIPTLAEILDLLRSRTLLNVEIKTQAVTDEAAGGITDKVLQLVRDRRMAEQVILSSFDPRALSQARQLDPQVRTASLFNRHLHRGRSPVEVMEEVGSVGLNIRDSLVTAEIVISCHQHGRPVAVYTVNEPRRMRELMDLGVDALFTDRPDLMLDLLSTTQG